MGRVKVYGTRIHVQGPLIPKAEAPDRSTTRVTGALAITFLTSYLCV